MKKITGILAAVAAIMASPLYLAAHEGHGHTHGFTIKHYFTEPVHLGVALLLIVLVALVFLNPARKKQSDKI